jgi:predicted TIM-barrel fold metal-dependent hydrolase
MDGTVSRLLSRGQEAGISQFVVLPVSNTPDRVRHINAFLLNEAQSHDCFIGFGTVHADMENLTDEVDWILQNGLKGIKMHPDSQKFNIDDPRLFPMYEAISGKIPVMPHMGDPRYDFSHPRKLRRVMELFPNLQVIATHFGGYSMYEEAYDLLHDKDCVFDVSSSLMFMPEGVAEKYINAYGAERMAFGTDFPLWDPVVETERFMRLNLTADQFDQIGHKTAQRVLGL